MILEKLGKLLLNKKNFVFILVFSCLPFLCICLLNFAKLKKLEKQKEKILVLRQQNFKPVIFDFANTEKELKNLKLKQEELHYVEELLSNRLFSQNKFLKNRLSFLKNNKISFEVENNYLKLTKPIYVNIADLQKILKLTEQFPFFIIKNFSLKRSEKDNSFIIHIVIQNSGNLPIPMPQI